MSRTGPVAGLAQGVVALAFVVLAWSARAHADTLRVSTLEYGSWVDAVAALQRDITAEGREFHIVVDDGTGQRVACGAYSLAPDAVSAAAFAFGACDPNTRATEVRLAHRTALFAHDGPVPRPRDARITAAVREVGSVAGDASDAAPLADSLPPASNALASTVVEPPPPAPSRSPQPRQQRSGVPTSVGMELVAVGFAGVLIGSVEFDSEPGQSGWLVLAVGGGVGIAGGIAWLILGLCGNGPYSAIAGGSAATPRRASIQLTGVGVAPSADGHGVMAGAMLVF